MSITCDKCGSVSNKYNVVSYSTDYIEKFLGDYFGNPFRDLISTNIKSPKGIEEKKVCLSILIKHTKLPEHKLKIQYNYNGSALLYAKEMEKKRSPDFVYLDNLLSEVNKK